MTTAVLTANLGSFDTIEEPPTQTVPVDYHCFTDEDFPPIADLPPRLQYRIPKMFGWQMQPDNELYLWMDGAFTLAREDSVDWFQKQLGDADFFFFKHPNRNTIREEVEHIDDYLNRRKGTKRGQDYLLRRYKNGLHNEQYKDILLDKDFKDDALYHSGVFMYRDSQHSRDVLRLWWLHQSRYYTCDQVVLPYVLKDSAVVVADIPINKCEYLKVSGSHQ